MYVVVYLSSNLPGCRLGTEIGREGREERLREPIRQALGATRPDLVDDQADQRAERHARRIRRQPASLRGEVAALVEEGCHPLQRSPVASLRGRSGGADVEQGQTGDSRLFGERLQKRLQPGPRPRRPALLRFERRRDATRQNVDGGVVSREEA